MRILFPILFMIIFLAFLGWANIYIARSIAKYFEIADLRILYILFAFLTVFMIGGLAGFTNSLSPIGSLIYKSSAITMGLILYLFITVIVINLLSLLIDIQPFTKGILVLVFTFGISLFGIINSFSLKVREIEIPVKGLQNKISAIHLSDIHIGHFRGQKFLQRIVKKTNIQKPDLVFITGDLFDGRIRLNSETLEPLMNMQAPVYFVEGNHDGYSGVKKIKSLLREKGVNVMENEVAWYKDLQIVGLNHLLPDSVTVGMHATLGKETIKNVLPTLNIDKSAPSVLLHHSPDGVQYASLEGIDLYLAGHTHAGQLFPITLINELIFKYNGGLDRFSNTAIYVSEGVGTFGPPMRVGTRSELALIKLTPKK